MDYARLQQSRAEKVQRGDSPHNEILQTQQMFSFPVACVVFALIGLGLGLHTRKRAGSRDSRSPSLLCSPTTP
jgi:lipopolysaccharide export LptBFGC system permease protein LptF